VFGTPVGGGYSGIAVLNRRTGAVCGMLFSAGKGGSAHMVSAADILAALPQIAQLQSDPAHNTRWLEELDDEQIRIGGWPYPGPLLRAYLDAAMHVAQEHPYPGVVPGTRLPLTTVHLRQQAQPATTEARADTGTSSPAEFSGSPGALWAQEVLDRDGDAVVIAGPGSGKSTLLRIGLITLAERWRAGRTGRWIPVHVPAANLAPPRPLHEALAARVSTDLNVADPTQEWPAQFFKTAPLRGVRWLVMVDGLDEITAPKARRRLVTKLANESAKPGSPYRFVATTRPLSPGERAEDPLKGWSARRYELLPFADEDLGRFAEQWFTVRELAEPERAARDFSSELQRRGLDDLPRIPLMATMLCQLYTAHPDRPLQKSRGQIYKDFLELLDERQRASALRAQTRAALQECGDDALTAAEKSLTNLQDLIACLAAERRTGNIAPALDILASQPEAARPKRFPEAEWRTFLDEILRSSGLLTVHAGEVVFLHQTLLEYFAAQHATRDAMTRARTYNALSRTARYWPWTDEPDIRPRMWGRRFWKPPASDSNHSFLGFLLDLGYAKPTDSTPVLNRLLKRLATRGGFAGSKFIAHQAQLGTRLPNSVTRAAADTLSVLARDPKLPPRTPSGAPVRRGPPVWMRPWHLPGLATRVVPTSSAPSPPTPPSTGHTVCGRP
jgi:uncharacterized protein YjeT (DUF2065 family)